MAITEIHIANNGSGFSVTPDSASFRAGDSVTFISAPDTADALICFSDAAADAIQPTPDDEIAIGGGASLTFQLTEDGAAGCCATVVASGHGGTPDCADVPTGVLHIAVISRRPLPGPDNPNG